MKRGLLERVLIRRYGPPVYGIKDGMAIKSWNTNRFRQDAELYLGMKWRSLIGLRYASLEPIYGDTAGGFLVSDNLRTAHLLPREIWGLRHIDELQRWHSVQRALVRDPAILYFMDASDIWYYGYKRGDLWCFDYEFDELYCMGPIEPALEQLIEDWISAGPDDEPH